MKCKNNILYPLVFLTSFALVSCGGSSNSSSSTTPKETEKDITKWVKGEFLASTNFKDKCEVPRSGVDINGGAFADTKGSAQYEKMWLRSMTHETYLWYQEVHDRDPSLYSIQNYFDRLKTINSTSSGLPKDRFHYSLPTEEANNYYEDGVTPGYGITWSFLNPVPPRRWVVQFVEPNSPAALAGIMRGFELKTVNDIDFVNTTSQSDIDSLITLANASTSGMSTRFSFTDLEGQTISSNITIAGVNLQPVQNVKVIDTEAAKVGYMLFNSHISTAQEGLVNGFQQFINENVTELVLDLRVNQGGLLDMASQVAYMIAGDAQTDKQIFLTNETNGKVVSTEIHFHSSLIDWQNYEFIEDQLLPSLELTRVYILTSNNTCSASEAIINGLRGIDVDVVLIGDQTCGKPYAFKGSENCGTTYFTIQAQGKNAKGFGAFADGFKPSLSPVAGDEVLGCDVADDFRFPLGSRDENLLASALNYMQNGECLTQLASTQRVDSEQVESSLNMQKTEVMLDAIKLEHQLNKRVKPLPVDK